MDEDPVFRGLHVFLSVVRELVDRPRWSPRRGRDGLRGDRPLPLLCLLGDTDGRDVPKALADRLGQAEAKGNRKVPHAHADAGRAAATAARRWQAVEREPPLLPLLDVLHSRLLADRFAADRLSSFRHYRLVDWLTGRRAEPGRTREDRAILRELRGWYAAADSSAEVERHAAAQQVVASSAVARFLLAVLTVWNRPLRFRLWVRGVPWVGREPRWLMRQPFLVPGHSTAFTGFAERLTAGRRDEENPEQLKKLLVHAFLQDLRLAYRPRGPRLRRWQRTAYPVVLLSGLTEDNGGWELLRIINDVRNESTEHDPLLVVASAAGKPADLQPDRPVAAVGRIKAELDRWAADLPGHRQSLRPDARFVFVALPPHDADRAADPATSQADESAWQDVGDRIQPREPPLPAREPVVVGAVIAVLLATALTAGPWGWVRARNDCLPDPSPGVAVRWIAATRSCVGYSDAVGRLFGSDPRLRAAQAAVFELNAEAERLHEQDPDRALVSVVYFADVSHPASDPGADASTSEELEGLLIRQEAQNDRQVGEVDVVCGRGEIAFYAGREGEFTGFLREVVGQCGNDRPEVIGDDTVARFIAQGDLRLQNEFKGIAVSFVSMGARVVVSGPDCVTKGEPATPDASHPGARPLVAFCTGHRRVRERTAGTGRVADFARLLAESGDRMPWPGERIGLAYDAASLFVEAVRENQTRARVPNPDPDAPSTGRRPVHRAAIAQELREPRRFEGATGPIDFGRSRTGLTRPLAILAISDVHDLAEVPRCVYEVSAPTDQTAPHPWGTPDC
ncbi:hypothetical protein ACIGNX_27855 [Actinosynnema sp. NPDC053489]|uniref:hypothetical protein n=1 Tax=Actinosynnema sp. NPDC053489 TaxID=3363916 RepID=UPI0037CBAD31